MARGLPPTSQDRLDRRIGMALVCAVLLSEIPTDGLRLVIRMLFCSFSGALEAQSALPTK